MKHKLLILLVILSALLSFACKAKPQKALPEEKPATMDSVIVVEDSVVPQAEKVNPAKHTVGKDSMEDWIAGYEKVVVAFEKKSADGKLSTKDMAEINAKMEALSDKQKDKNLTPSQMSRLTALALRLTKVLQKIKPF